MPAKALLGPLQPTPEHQPDGLSWGVPSKRIAPTETTRGVLLFLFFVFSRIFLWVWGLGGNLRFPPVFVLWLDRSGARFCRLATGRAEGGRPGEALPTMAGRRDDFTMKKGDTIAQLILERVSILEPEISVQRPLSTQRGGKGFGQTDAGLAQGARKFGTVSHLLRTRY